jgi:hypothetical protein
MPFETALITAFNLQEKPQIAQKRLLAGPLGGRIKKY